MTTLHHVFIRCPHCKKELSDYGIMSYSVFRSTVFSDGKMISEPYVDHDRDIALCEACGKLFWREDAEELTEDTEYYKKELVKAGDIMDLPLALAEDFPEKLVSLYDELIRNGFAGSQERRMYLRIRLWWAINDLVRNYSPLRKQLSGVNSISGLGRFLKEKKNKRKAFKHYRKLFEENLRELIKIYSTITDEDTLMLAEMHRELGNYSAALSLLAGLDHLTWKAYRKIRSASRWKRKKVFLISGN
jgi:tetratricopeptide (TPR) repeat protein